MFFIKVSLACVALVLVTSSCSWLPFSKDCCDGDRVRGLSYLQEDGQFQTKTLTRANSRVNEPAPGETITKQGLLSKYNPFKSLMDAGDESAPTASDDEEGVFRNLLPF